MDPATLELSTHTPTTLAVHVDQLNHEHDMLEANLRRLAGEVLNAKTQARQVDEELRAAQITLSMVNQTVGPAREILIKLSNDLVAAERDYRAAEVLHDRIAGLGARIKDWVSRATNVVEPSAVVRDMPYRDKFLAAFRRNAVDLGCAGVRESAAGEINLDASYVPMFRERLLRSFGSASDRARLVTAYVTALLMTGKNHPGFVVLDEPLQQNPDAKHLAYFEKFLVKHAQIDKQIVIFTSLSKDLRERLTAAGVRVRHVEERFLQRVGRE